VRDQTKEGEMSGIYNNINGELRNIYEILIGKPEGRDRIGNLGVDVLKLML
jgi:hypothetical protein